MVNLTYLTYEEALAIYYKTVEKSGGGMAGVRDEGGIRSTLDFVQDDLYYPEIADKAAYLIKEALSQGDVSSNEMYKMLEAEGISQRTAEDTRKNMGIRCYRKMKQWYWSIKRRRSST